MTLFPPRDRPEGPSSGRPLFLPHGEALETGRGRGARSLPPDLRNQVTRRLRLIAIVYSAAFFAADLVPSAISGQIVHQFQHPILWIPTVVSILAGLSFAALISHPRLGWEAKLNLGLVFEVLSCYGIALSMYLDLGKFQEMPLAYYVLSPSWPAIWMIAFSIVVPAPPGRALLAQLASASAAPVVIGLVLQREKLLHLIPGPAFFFSHVFPYLICVGLAYVSARIVYALGADVSRARELGSYKLVELLGQGGMGEVWKASHQLLARPAAIKFIRPERIAAASPEEARTTLKRFELEARATASLSSAHTVDLYDFGITDDGAFYYVMELLDGLDCERLVQRFGRLPPARVVHLLAQVCESLDEAHAKGLIHRDVKPANIYVCRSGTRLDFVKVLDFGLVAHRSAPSAPELRLTLPEQAVGTPEFMPPEVALGQPVDGRADLYGLGCVAYWLLTARSAFEGANFYEVVSKHLHVAPDPPSRHAPGLPHELDGLILECLEKTPEKRPSSARELARRLRAVPLAEPWDEEDAAAWWTAHITPGLGAGTDGAPMPGPTPERQPAMERT
jgi:serine/threonine-protein kinase